MTSGINPLRKLTRLLIFPGHHDTDLDLDLDLLIFPGDDHSSRRAGSKKTAEKPASLSIGITLSLTLLS